MTSSEFTHLVITRYAVAVPGRTAPPDADWLRYRLGFFEQALCQSLAAQTCQDFTWLVYVDDRCPPDFRDVMDDLATEFGFEPIWTHELFSQRVARDVAERAATPFVITTRIDSDDAVAKEFVESVQREFKPWDRLFVDFMCGLQVDRSGSVYRFDVPSSPFMSMIERRGETLPTTVFGMGHTMVRYFGPLRIVVGPPMWLMVVHGGNWQTQIGGPRVLPRQLNERFSLSLLYREDVGGARFVWEKIRDDTRLWAHRARHLQVGWAVRMRARWRGSVTLTTAPPPLGEPSWRLRARRWRDRHLGRG